METDIEKNVTGRGEQPISEGMKTAPGAQEIACEEAVEAPLFRAESRMDYAEYERFNLFVMKHHRTWLAKAVPFVLMIGLGAVIVDCVLLRQYVAALIVAALLCWYVWDKVEQRSAKKHIRRVYETNKMIQNTLTTFSFYREHFVSEAAEGRDSIPYDKLYAVLESETNFYLMIARNQGMVLRKENCSAELQEFLRHLKPSATDSMPGGEKIR